MQDGKLHYEKMRDKVKDYNGGKAIMKKGCNKICKIKQKPSRNL